MSIDVVDENCRPSLDSVTSFDTSQVVNDVYEHNLHADKDVQGAKKNIGKRVNVESIKLNVLDGKADVWTMSPPCQPFTTTKDAQRKDTQDKRNAGFCHLMKMIELMETKPKYIFFENVKGFVNSDTHSLWTESLKRSGYVWRQYLLTPLQFRIPNNRMRFYMVCKLSDGCDGGYTQDMTLIHNDVQECSCPGIKTCTVNGQALDCSYLSIDGPLHKIHELGEDDITGPAGVNNIGKYISAENNEDEKLLVKDKVLKARWAQGLSYVGEEDRCTFCFTSSYGKTIHKASGSCLHLEEKRGKRVVKEDDMTNRYSGKVRLFSPDELLRIFGFPDWFTYPDTFTDFQKWKVIGQSVNVITVAAIMHSVLCQKAIAENTGAPLDKKRRIS